MSVTQNSLSEDNSALLIHAAYLWPQHPFIFYNKILTTRYFSTQEP